jgi:hypothetical protein
MAQYRLAFHAYEPLYYSLSMANRKSVERKVNASTPQQAFRIAQSIAKKNGWVASGEPVKL